MKGSLKPTTPPFIHLRSPTGSPPPLFPYATCSKSYLHAAILDCQVLPINLVKITENYTHFLSSMTHTFYATEILQSQTTNIDVQDFAMYITHTHLLQHLSTLDSLWCNVRLRDCICSSLTALATIMNTLPRH